MLRDSGNAAPIVDNNPNAKVAVTNDFSFIAQSPFKSCVILHYLYNTFHKV